MGSALPGRPPDDSRDTRAPRPRRRAGRCGRRPPCSRPAPTSSTSPPIICCARSVRDLGAEEDAGERLVATSPSTDTSNGCGSRPALPTVIARPRYREARDAALQHLAADRVDDEVDAAAAGDLAHVRDPVGLRVVDAVVEAERSSGCEPLVARRGRERRSHRRASRAGSPRCRRRPRRPGSARSRPRRGDRTRTGSRPRCRTRPARTRHATRSAPSGIGHVTTAGGDRRARRASPTASWRRRADRRERSVDAFADLADRPRALVPDDVREW